DGIRDFHVTGVQTCALPIFTHLATALDTLPVHALPAARPYVSWLEGIACNTLAQLRKLPRQGLQQRSSPLLVDALDKAYGLSVRSEERRVGKECWLRWERDE